MRRAAENDERSALFFRGGEDIHLGKAVAKELAGAFGPIRENAGALLQSFIDPVHDGAIGTRPRDAEKVSASRRDMVRVVSVQRFGQAERDSAYRSPGYKPGGVRNIPR